MFKKSFDYQNGAQTAGSDRWRTLAEEMGLNYALVNTDSPVELRGEIDGHWIYVSLAERRSARIEARFRSDLNFVLGERPMNVMFGKGHFVSTGHQDFDDRFQIMGNGPSDDAEILRYWNSTRRAALLALTNVFGIRQLHPTALGLGSSWSLGVVVGFSAITPDQLRYLIELVAWGVKALDQSSIPQDTVRNPADRTGNPQDEVRG